AIVRPEPLDPKQASPKYITSVTSATINGDSPPNDRHVALLFTTDDLAVEPGKPLTIAASTYLGPRWRAVLNQPWYAGFPLNSDLSLVLTSGPCGFCTFAPLVTALVALLNGFHWIFGGFAGHG